MLIEEERIFREKAERLSGEEKMGCFGRGSGEDVGQFERRGKVVGGRFAGGQVGGVGEAISRRIPECVLAEMVGGKRRGLSTRRDFVGEKVSGRRRDYRCSRRPGAWGLARPSSPVSGFASDRTRRTTGGPVDGESIGSTTSPRYLAQTVPRLRSIKAGFGTWFLGVCGGEMRGR